MRVHVDMSKCQAYGMCADEAPEVFGLDEWGYAQVLQGDDLSDDHVGPARRAIDACPAQAILGRS